MNQELRLVVSDVLRVNFIFSDKEMFFIPRQQGIKKKAEQGNLLNQLTNRL